MPNIEHKVRLTSLKKNILRAIGGFGIVSVALIAPGALSALKIFNIDKKLRVRKGYSYFRSLKRLEKDGLVRISKYNNKWNIETTLKGRNALDLNPKIKRKWDGKWRVLIFDIPEKRKDMRKQIRMKLISLGFLKLQNSVWIFPYDCEDFITLLKTELKTGKLLLYMIVEAIEEDAPLRKHFKLPLC